MPYLSPTSQLAVFSLIISVSNQGHGPTKIDVKSSMCPTGTPFVILSHCYYVLIVKNYNYFFPAIPHYQKKVGGGDICILRST